MQIQWFRIFAALIFTSLGSLSVFAQSNSAVCPPATGGPSDKVPVVILQKGATEAAKAFEDERSITKNKYLETLRKFVILHTAKTEANRKAQEALQLEAIELAAFQQQIVTQLTNTVGAEVAEALMTSWKRGATAEEQEKILKDFAISGKTYRGLFADLAKAKGLSEDQIASAKNESFEFVEFPAGEFTMGSPDGVTKNPDGVLEPKEVDRNYNEAQRKVKITKAFEIQKTSVTQLQYYLVTGTNPSHFINADSSDYMVVNGNKLSANRPVEQVSWNDAQEFIRKLNEQDSKYAYRLPTEAEWEYAARAGTKTAYSFGNRKKDLDEYAVYNTSQTAQVASKKPNPLGLYDMHGNVFQWCKDGYCSPPKGNERPTGDDSSSYRVIRGGSWSYDFPQNLRSAGRGGGLPDNLSGSVGFRLVRTPK